MLPVAHAPPALYEAPACERIGKHGDVPKERAQACGAGSALNGLQQKKRQMNGQVPSQLQRFVVDED